MSVTTLRSIDLHLDYPAGAVVEADELVEIAAGMYPCYYTRENDTLLASTSVTELVAELGDLNLNPQFSPPDYFEGGLLDVVEKRFPGPIRRRIPSQIRDPLHKRGLMSSNERYYQDPEPIDKRVSVLKPFQRVTVGSKQTDFEPTYSITEQDEFIEKQAKYITEFIQSIERQYPDHQHLIRVGGKDSQLIALVPKLTDNWHVFSAEPNYPLVKQFIENNDLEIGRLFRHDNKNEEAPWDLKRKIVSNDLRTDPRHLRWFPTLEEIVEELGGDCIMWGGQLGDTINSYHHAYQSGDYFKSHLTRGANWQGVTAQAILNFTGAPSLSPYHSEALWDSVYRHYDPGMITQGVDLRKEIGARLRGDEVWWPSENPSPSAYEYGPLPDPASVYKSYIEDRLAGGQSWIGVDRDRPESHRQNDLPTAPAPKK